jgi:ubiquinone/menaquinone biosynthesis C-methylase UbiE
VANSVETETPNAGEAAYWTSRSGQKWVDYQQSLDRLFSEVAELLIREAAHGSGESVLDLGCGTGATSLALASCVAPGGDVVGIDISSLLLGIARDRAAAAECANVRFVEADAQTHAFEPGRFDLLVSRFGSMFFGGPVEAFENMRTGLRSGGRVYLAAWAPVSNNPWFAIAGEAAMARLGSVPKAEPNTPGPFGFANRDYASGILRDAGFADIAVDAVTVELVAPDSPSEAAELACNVGQAVRIIAAKNGTAEDAAAIADAVAATLLAYQTSNGIRIPAMINLISARCP